MLYCVVLNRFWGTPIPLWTSEDGEERIAIGSVEQLETLSGVKVHTIHYTLLYLISVTCTVHEAVTSSVITSVACNSARLIVTRQ